MTSRIENCTESLQVIINKWYTASNKVVESITPPLEGINIPIAGTVIKASPFKEKSDKAGGPLTSADIDRVVEQNSYFNQILHTISRQIEDTKPSLSGRPTPASTSSNHNIETYPGFKIPEFSKEKFPKLSDTFEVTGNIIEKINAQLNNFNISVKQQQGSVTGNDRVELASYQLKDVAHIWYTQWKENRGTDAAPITWECFSETFLDRFFPIELREARA
ncbi:hypothetical protein KY284_020180 [Solanum tuberosum]|nr:hypothetical protein KY284_020180 [Solanum tuberosum]